MNKGKKITAAVAASAVATTLVAPAAFAATNFQDIGNSFAKDAILELAAKGILNGKSETAFDPTGLVTRAEFAKILVLSKGIAPEAATTSSFADVPAGHWAVGYIEAAKKAGLINGYDATTFGLNDQLTREQMATLFVRATGANVAGKGASLTFADAGQISDYAKDAVAYAVELGLINGVGGNNFAPQGNATREAVAKVAKLFIDKTQVSALASVSYVDAGTLTLNFSKEVAEVKAEDVKVAVKATNAAVAVKEVTLAADKKSATVKVDALAASTTFAVSFGGKSVDVTTPGAVAATVAVSAANTVKVTFNQAVDTTKAVFAAKKGLSTVALDAAEWNAAKTEATLKKASGNFIEGDYTLSVTGLSTEAISSTFKVEAQKVAKIEIVGEDAIRDVTDETLANVSYKVFDQYNTDITKTATVNVTASGGVAPTVDKTNKQIELAYGVAGTGYDASNAPTKVTVTITDPATGTSTYKTVNIAASAKVSNFEFGELTFPENTDKLFLGDAEAGSLEFAAVDQYGNAITDPTQLAAALEIVSSNDDVAFTFEYENEKSFLNIDTFNLQDDATVTLTIVNKSTGAPVSKQLKIEKQAAPAEIAFGELSKEVVAAGDTVYMDITVTDQFGNTMKADDYAKLGVAALSLTATGGLQGQLAIETDKNSANYGKLVLTPGAEGKATMISTLGGKSVTYLVDVKETRALTEVNAAPTQYLTQGASADLGFVFLDQYGAELDAAIANADLTYAITVEKVSGDDGAVTVTAPAAGSQTGADETVLNTITVKGDATKTGSAKVTVELLDGATVVSSATTTVSVVKNNVSGLTYSIKAIPTLAGDQDYAATDIYARNVKVEAKDASGNSYAINPDDIISVTSSDEGVADVDVNGGKWYVFGQDITTDNTDDLKSTVTVTLNTLDGIKTVSTDVTVSPKVAKAQEIKIVDGPILVDATTEGSVRDTLDNAYTALSNVSYIEATQAELTTGIDLNVVLKDQYGIWSNVDAGTVVVNSTNKAAANAFTFATGTLTLANTTGLVVGEELAVTLLVDGKALSFTIKVNA